MPDPSIVEEQFAFGTRPELPVEVVKVVIRRFTCGLVRCDVARGQRLTGGRVCGIEAVRWINTSRPSKRKKQALNGTVSS